MDPRPSNSPWRWHAALAAGVAVLVLLVGNPCEPLERRTLDAVLRGRLEWGGARPMDRRIAFLDVDHRDLEGLATLESEYAAVAAALDQISELGAAVLALDVLYRRGNEPLARPLLEAIARAERRGSRVVLAEVMLPVVGAADDANHPGKSTEGGERLRSFSFLPPRAGLSSTGLVNVESDPDGVHRRYALVQTWDGHAEPSLALAAYLAAVLPAEGRVAVRSPRPGVLAWEELAGDFITLNTREADDHPRLLNFRSPWADDRPDSVGDGVPWRRHWTLGELRGLHASAAGGRPLAGRIVLLSYVAAGAGDLGATPLAPHEPKVTLHAVALNDLLQNTTLHRVPRPVDALGAAAAVGLTGLLAGVCRRKRTLVAGWISLLAALLAAALVVCLQLHLVLGAVLFLVAGGAALVGEIARRHTAEWAERLRLSSTMAYYFSPRVLDEVLRRPGAMDPQEVEITALLTDLRNSTPLAETLGARRMFALLNQVFEVQTRAVMAEDGTLEHFLGDQFLAYWGAPGIQPDAAARALRGAWTLVEGLEALRADLPPDVEALFGYGVALHSGAALIGNKGSAQRLDYGVVGDLINAAARVESLTKHYGVLFLATGEFLARLPPGQLPLRRRLDRVRVKGKREPLELFEIAHPFSQPDFAATAGRYEAAFSEYQGGRFDVAAGALATLAETGDVPSRVLMERCREFREKGMPADWTGVYDLLVK